MEFACVFCFCVHVYRNLHIIVVITIQAMDSLRQVIVLRLVTEIELVELLVRMDGV